MRSISTAGLAQLSQGKGNVPISIVEVDWAGVGAYSPYADATVDTIPGKIKSLSTIDNVVGISNSESTQEMKVVLWDTDGSIKSLFDQHDIHQRNVRVYQYFEGLDLDDRFIVFSGKVSGPIEWSEAERTLSFNVVSQLEDKEFGFSAEEGQFPFVPKDLVGKPWPVVFGRVLDYPALQVNTAVTGTTLCGVGIISGRNAHLNYPMGGNECSLGVSLAQSAAQMRHLGYVQSAYLGAGDQTEAASLTIQMNQLRQSMMASAQQQTVSKSCAASERKRRIDDAESKGQGCNPVRILGGEDFVQNTAIELSIGGGIFRGKMTDDSFKISSRRFPEDEEEVDKKPGTNSGGRCSQQSGGGGTFDFKSEVPCGQGDFAGCSIHTWGFIVSSCSQDGGEDTASQVAKHRWFEPGSRVSMHSDEPITYIASITPGQVLAVKAYKQFEGQRRLVNVPSDLWRVEVKTYGTITAVQVVTKRPLSTIPDQGWSDDVYVTFESTIGPNIVDILEYIIDNYTDLDFDETSFDVVKAKLENFPANFPVLERKNTLTILQEIAYQARCALLLNNGVFYLKYLPEEPTSDDTIQTSDNLSKNTVVTLTPTEDLVTKMVVTWRMTWDEEDPNKIILRHNVNKYGTKEEEYFFYIYNQPDSVLKCATFWLVRKANTWKKIRLKVPMTKLRLETFDTVTLNLPAYVASGPVKAIVEQADYDSAAYSIDLECWVPVRAGEMVKYKFAWPASLTVSDTFPTPEAIANGEAGGDGIGANATGELPIGYTDGINSGGTVFVGGPNVVFGQQSDRGDKTPTDVGFTPQELTQETTFADITNVADPRPDLTLNRLRDQVFNPKPLADGAITIDIHKTRIYDSETRSFSYLKDFIETVSGKKIYLKSKIKYKDEAEKTGDFEVKFDTESNDFAAKKAFLKEDE